MTPELIRIIVAVAGGLAVLAAVVIWWMNRTPHVEGDDSGTVPLFGGVDRGAGATPDVGIMEGGTVRLQAPYTTPPDSAAVEGAKELPGSHGTPGVRSRPDRAREPRTKERQGGLPVDLRSDVLRRVREDPSPPPAKDNRPQVASSTVREFVTGGLPAPPPVSVSGTDAAVVSEAGVPGTMVEGHLLRFSVPAEGTLQFLPGRLEIASGMDAGREIRFVRVPGPHETEVTFGRSEGELYRHIQLRDQTVSRAHAVMRLVDSVWTLMNHSRTNPVVHNGKVLGDGAEQELEDGDRIEMGEVLFTFRNR